MGTLNEKRVDTMRLTNNQKKLMTRVLVAPTPLRKSDEASEGSSIVAARKILVNLGLIVYSDESAKITDNGKIVMRNANLIDASGKLTPTGLAYAEHADHVTESLFVSIDNQANAD